MQPRILPKFPALAAATLAMVSVGQAATPVFFDGFDSTVATSDINQNIPTRQGGAIAFLTGGVTYQSNFINPDYHHQMFGNPSPLQIAGDANGWGGGFSTVVSPTYNFKGMLGGEMVGKQISFNVDTFYNNPGAPVYLSYTAITVAADYSLQVSGVGGGFSVRFEESDFGSGAAQTITFWDGALNVGSYLNPAGTGGMAVDLFIDDYGDYNPWDGVGSTSIGVVVNGNAIGSYTKGGGGYTNNYITLEGSSNLAGVQTGLHTFDNLTVFTAPIPEPSAALLGGLGLLGLLRRRR